MLTIADALPSGKASAYVAAAYLVFLLLLVVYLTIMAVKVQRIEKDLRELAGFAESRAQGEEAAPRRGSEPQSISVSSGASESGGGAA